MCIVIICSIPHCCIENSISVFVVKTRGRKKERSGSSATKRWAKNDCVLKWYKLQGRFEMV